MDWKGSNMLSPFFPTSRFLRVFPSFGLFCHRRSIIICPNPKVLDCRQSTLVTHLSSDDDGDDNARPLRRHGRHVVKLYNILHQGCIQYESSWAWQQILLHRRLQSKRRRQQDDKTVEQSSLQLQQQQHLHHSHDDDDDNAGDCILMLEHSPVYTLGRGADENHLTFLRQRHENQEARKYNKNNNNRTCSSSLDDDVQTIMRWKLSRTARGPGTARLSFDRHIMEKCLGDNNKTSSPWSIQEDAMELVQNMLTTQVINPVYAPNGVPIFRVERGGEVTFHGPQQLVVYPLLDLQNDNNNSNHASFQQDLHWYLRRIEEVVMQTLQDFGIEGATRDDANTGVWVDQKKVAAVGISASRWITTHGLALNVNPDLSYFDTSMILPCGVEGRGVTSMAEILRKQQGHTHTTAVSPPRIPTMEEVAKVVAKNFEKVFDIELQQH
jgi:lipoyl(octanoyl) transferase